LAERRCTELRAAFGDSLASFARIYEVAVVGIVLALMVTKPF